MILDLVRFLWVKAHQKFARRDQFEFHSKRVREVHRDAQILRPRFLMTASLLCIKRGDGWRRGRCVWRW